MKRSGKGLFRTEKIVLIAAALGLLVSCQHFDNEPDEADGKGDVTEAYDVFEMDIQVQNNAPIVSKEEADYLNCTVKVNGKGILDDYQGTARIRYRGNSSWLWYDKKSYRVKLDQKSGILGLKRDRDWVLLANYRDPTDLMNTFAFEVAQWLGLPYSNHTRYVEVTLNGSYIGLYQLTEQVEQGDNRVNVDPVDGMLIELDADDGPYYSPNATDNFWSSVFELPVCVKYPEGPTADQLSAVRNDFAKLETAVKNYEYDSVAVLLDIPSFINNLILQEMVYNVEVDAPRSLFMFKDKGGKYMMGPSWDFDAGYDFDWSTMMTGHNYFNAQEVFLGTDPANHTNGYRVSDFFTQMFRNKRFVEEYKARWNEVKDSIFTHSWEIMENYRLYMQDAMAREAKKWPIDKNYVTETNRLEKWLSDRVTYLTTVINNYPAGSVTTTKIGCGTISCDVTMSYKLGYGQTMNVNIDQNLLLSKLVITSSQLNSTAMRIVPLNTDGTEGANNTNGVYGGWFEADNNPGYWSNGHVYIEVFSNLTVWNCGLRAESGFCAVGDHHTVKMQYQYTQGMETKTVTIIVNFTIAA